jgi:hypothetical protein
MSQAGAYCGDVMRLKMRSHPNPTVPVQYLLQAGKTMGIARCPIDRSRLAYGPCGRLPASSIAASAVGSASFGLFSSRQYAIITFVKLCHSCKSELAIGRSVGRRDECPSCHSDIHCCLNCAFYDRSASKQCREPAAELVKEKARANFCDFFSFSERTTTHAETGTVAQSRKALDDLFKK